MSIYDVGKNLVQLEPRHGYETKISSGPDEGQIKEFGLLILRAMGSIKRFTQGP